MKLLLLSNTAVDARPRAMSGRDAAGEPAPAPPLADADIDGMWRPVESPGAARFKAACGRRGSEPPVGSTSIARQVIARMASKQASVGSMSRSQMPTWYSAFRVTPLWQ